MAMPKMVASVARQRTNMFRKLYLSDVSFISIQPLQSFDHARPGYRHAGGNAGNHTEAAGDQEGQANNSRRHLEPDEDALAQFGDVREVEQQARRANPEHRASERKPAAFRQNAEQQFVP